MLAETQILSSLRQPSASGLSCHRPLHTLQNGHPKTTSLSILPLHPARFLWTKISSPSTNAAHRNPHRTALLIGRASLGQDLSDLEAVDAEEEVQLDTSVFEEINPPVQKKKASPPGTRVRGVPLPQSTLVPDDWKEVQQYLHRSKKERKQETLARQHEWAKRRALEDRLTKQELKNERRLASEQGGGGGAVVSDDDDEAPTDEEEELDTEEETPSPSFTSGRASPKDFRSELQFSSLEEIAGSLAREEEEVESSSEVEADEQVTKEDSRDAQKGYVKNLLTPEEKAMLRNRTLNYARVSSKKWSPLHTLAASGQVYLAAELLKKEVDPNAVDSDGLTPLHRAVQAGQKTMVRMLLKVGADAGVVDPQGATLLHYSARNGDHQICKLLLRYGVDVNAGDADGWTPLHVAVQSGRLELIKALVYRGADVNIANSDGNTALDVALAFGGCFNFYDGIKFLKRMSVLDSASGFARNEFESGQS